jgi:hypothetical protein
MNMESYTHANNPNLLDGTVAATLDFSHTAYWNGMGGIFDANGNPQNPEFWSQSGVDWRNAVPEPATIVALALGVVALVRRRERNKHRR